MPVRLEPFVRVDDAAFSMTQEELRQVRGRPLHESRSSIGLNELDYGSHVFRFQDCGRLEEITLQAPVLEIGRVAVPFASLESFIKAQDAQAFVRADFLVSPAFGLAWVPSQPCWVTALAAHCLDEWRALPPG